MVEDPEYEAWEAFIAQELRNWGIEVTTEDVRRTVKGYVQSLLLKVVLIRVDAGIAFQGSVAWQVRVYPNLTLYLRPVGAGVRCPSSTSRPPPQAPPATA